MQTHREYADFSCFLFWKSDEYFLKEKTFFEEAEKFFQRLS